MVFYFTLSWWTGFFKHYFKWINKKKKFEAKLKSSAYDPFILIVMRILDLNTNMNPDPVQWTRIWIRTQSSVHEYEYGSSTVYTNMKFDNFSYQKKVQNVETWINIQWGFNGIKVDTKMVCFEINMFYFSIFRYLLCHLEFRGIA